MSIQDGTSSKETFKQEDGQPSVSEKTQRTKDNGHIGSMNSGTSSGKKYSVKYK